MTEANSSDWSRRLGASDFAKPVRGDGELKMSGTSQQLNVLNLMSFDFRNMESLKAENSILW